MRRVAPSWAFGISLAAASLSFSASADEATVNALIASGFPLTPEAQAELLTATPETLAQVLANIVDQAIRANPAQAAAIVRSAISSAPEQAAGIAAVAVAAAPDQAAVITQAAVEANPAEAENIVRAAVAAAPEAAAEISAAATAAAPEAAEAIAAIAAEAEPEAAPPEAEVVAVVEDDDADADVDGETADVSTSADEVALAEGTTETIEEVAEAVVPDVTDAEAVVPDVTDADDTVPSPSTESPGSNGISVPVGLLNRPEE